MFITIEDARGLVLTLIKKLSRGENVSETNQWGQDV